MTAVEINGTDFHNFPDNEDVKKSLFWMGENYLVKLLEDFSVQFKKQDAGTTIVAVKSEAEPEFSYKASAKDGVIHGVNVTFKLQFLLLAGSGQHWRIQGICLYSAKELHTENSTIEMEFNLASAEAV